MTQQEANAKIADIIKEIENLLEKAQEIADEAGVSFYWDGPTYGMGGTYNPKLKPEVKSEDEWESSSSSEDDWGWRTSSEQY